MNKDKIAKELIADGHSLFRMSSRLQAIAQRLNDPALTRLADEIEGKRGKHCASLRAVAVAAEQAGLIGPDIVAAAAAPKDPPPND